MDLACCPPAAGARLAASASLQRAGNGVMKAPGGLNQSRYVVGANRMLEIMLSPVS